MLEKAQLLTDALTNVALECYRLNMTIHPHPPVIPAHRSRARIFLAKDGWTELRPGTPNGELDRVEKIFFDEYRFRRFERKQGRKAPDRLTPIEWLRVSLYSVILVWFGYQDGDELDERVPAKKANSDKIRRKASAEFHLAIAGIFARNQQIITPTERNRLADPMWHAFRHYVPPELLLGFNTQYPAHEKENMAALGEIDPALTAWVTEQRLLAAYGDRDCVERRGQYPREIEDFIADKLDAHHAAIVERRQQLRGQRQASDDWPE